MKQERHAAFGYCFAFLLLLITEIVIGIYGLGIVRAYVGDVLVIPLLYCLIRMFTERFPRTLPVLLFGVGCLAEFLQFIRIHEILGIPEGTPFGIIIGTRADWMDVLCYGIGTLLILGTELILKCLFPKH